MSDTISAMMLIIHITIALASIGITTYTYLRPSRRILHSAYTLLTATLATGMYLVLSNTTHLMQACLTGLAYTAGVGFALFVAHRKLAAEHTQK